MYVQCFAQCLVHGEEFVHSFLQQIIVAHLPCVPGAKGKGENKTEEVRAFKKLLSIPIVGTDNKS